MSNQNGNREESLKALLQELQKVHPDVREADVYIAGAEAANSITEQFFLELGLPKTRVFKSA